MTTELESLGAPLRELRSRFEAEVEPHRPALWRYCLRLTGSAWDAEDLVQDVMERALARLSKLWQPVNTRAYLFRIATNAWIDRRRREVRAEILQYDSEQPVASNVGETRAAAHEAIEHLVRSLSPLQRVVFLLCETLDFRAKEAASLLNTTEGAVKAALHRARASLAASAFDEQRTARLVASEDLDPVLRRYIAAFDARDPDAIAALLHEDAVTMIVGSAIEIGRDVSRSNSLAEWVNEPTPQRACAGVLEDRDVLFVFSTCDSGEEVLHTIVELDIVDHAVVEQRNYFFSPELLAYAAAALGVSAAEHGYQYTFTG